MNEEGMMMIENKDTLSRGEGSERHLTLCSDDPKGLFSPRQSTEVRKRQKQLREVAVGRCQERGKFREVRRGRTGGQDVHWEYLLHGGDL